MLYVQVDSLSGAGDPAVALHAADKLLADWVAGRAQRRRIHPHGFSKPVKPYHLPNGLHFDSDLPAANKSEITEWLAFHPRQSTELSSGELEDLDDFQPFRRKSQRAPQKSESVSSGDIMAEDDEAEEDFRDERGKGLLWHVLRPPFHTPAVVGPLPSPAELLPQAIQRRLVPKPEVNAALCSSKRAFWIVPIYAPAPLPLTVAAPVWGGDEVVCKSTEQELHWSIKKLAEFWSLLVGCVVKGRLGDVEAFAAEDDVWHEHIRIWCSAEKALGVRWVLSGSTVGPAVLPLFDSMGRPLLLA